MSGPPKFDHVKDSGKRQDFDTGSRRDTQIGKGRFDLISPVFLKRLAVHCENGANNYGDRNWEKGQPLQRYLDSASRHLADFLEGDRAEDHLTAVAWNMMGLIHTQEMIDRSLLPISLDDLPSSYKAEPVEDDGTRPEDPHSEMWEAARKAIEDGDRTAYLRLLELIVARDGDVKSEA